MFDFQNLKPLELTDQGTVYKVEPAFTLYVWLTLTGDLAVL